MPEATFPPQNYSGLCKLHSCVRFQSKLWVVSPEGGGNEVEMYVKKNSFHFLWTFKGLISASTTVPKYPHRSLGDEGRTCHFKSTTTKRAQEFLCPCLSLLCRWRTKEAWFNLLLLLFFFPFFLQSSLILALMLFKLALPEMSKGPHMVTVRSAPNLAGAWPAENNCALGWVRERRNLKDAQDTSGDDSNHLLWQSREIRQQLR